MMYQNFNQAALFKHVFTLHLCSGLMVQQWQLLCA